MVVALRLPVQAYAYEKPLLADAAPALWRFCGLLPTRIGTHCVIKKEAAPACVAGASFSRCRRSESGFFNHSLLAAVVAAFAAYGVVDMPCTAVRAESQSGRYGLVVSTALCSAGLGLLAFRMCHCFFILWFFIQ